MVGNLNKHPSENKAQTVELSASRFSFDFGLSGMFPSCKVFLPGFKFQFPAAFFNFCGRFQFPPSGFPWNCLHFCLPKKKTQVDIQPMVFMFVFKLYPFIQRFGFVFETCILWIAIAWNVTNNNQANCIDKHHQQQHHHQHQHHQHHQHQHHQHHQHH